MLSAGNFHLGCSLLVWRCSAPAPLTWGGSQSLTTGDLFPPQVGAHHRHSWRAGCGPAREKDQQKAAGIAEKLGGGRKAGVDCWGPHRFKTVCERLLFLSIDLAVGQ